jgi:hypothetical protein
LKTDLYDFDLKQNDLRVFDGKASVDTDSKNITVKGGHELSLADNSSLIKESKFDKKSYEEGDLEWPE